MKDTEAAYLAGFMDGEGSFMLLREKYKNKNNYFYKVTISAASTTLSVLEYCKSLTGGYIVKMKMNRKNPTWNDAYIWTMHGKNTTQLLRELIPYLIIKKEQAELLLKIRENTRIGAKRGQWGHVLDKHELELREQIYERIKYLNRRGYHGDVKSDAPLVAAVEEQTEKMVQTNLFEMF